MADAPKPVPTSADQPVVVTTGTLGLVAALAKILAGLTTDKALTLFVCAGFGWLLFITLKSTSEDKAAQVRMAEDARERDRAFYAAQRDADRKHCDDREDKRQRDKEKDEDKLKAFFAAESDKQRIVLTEMGLRMSRLEGIVRPKGPGE